MDVGCRRLLYSIIHDVTDRKRAEEALRHQALHDPLTDLPNRTLLSQRIVQAIDDARRENTQLSLLLLDVDRFKEINDTLGHAVGDALLCQFASRVKRTS